MSASSITSPVPRRWRIALMVLTGLAVFAMARPEWVLECVFAGAMILLWMMITPQPAMRSDIDGYTTVADAFLANAMKERDLRPIDGSEDAEELHMLTRLDTEGL